MKNAFRSFTDSPAAHEFIRDVLDGFFPWEFNESHPEGVQFSWKDFRSRRCPFSSKGYSLLDSEPVSDADPAISLPERSDPGATTPQRKQQSLAQLGGPVLRVTQTAQATDGIPQSPMSAVQSALDKVGCIKKEKLKFDFLHALVNKHRSVPSCVAHKRFLCPDPQARRSCSRNQESNRQRTAGTEAKQPCCKATTAPRT